MAGSAAGAVQAAVFSLLSTDATLKGLTGAHPDDSNLARVYDEPPEGAAFPYVLILEPVERSDNRMGGKVGRDLDVFIEAVSEKRGNKECQDLLARVDVLLDNAVSLSVSGYTTELVNFEGAQYSKETRNGTPLRRGVATYHIQVLAS